MMNKMPDVDGPKKGETMMTYYQNNSTSCSSHKGENYDTSNIGILDWMPLQMAHTRM